MFLRFIFILIGFVLLEIYAFKVVFRPFERLSKKWKRIIVILYNLYPVGMLLLGLILFLTGFGRFRMPESMLVDYLFIYPFWISTLILFQVALIVLPYDLVKTLIKGRLKRTNFPLKEFDKKFVLGVLIFFLAYIPVRVAYDYNTIEINEVVYQKKNLPGRLEDFKLVLISDVQADRYTDKNRLEKFVNKINSLEPDLVLIAGDIITSGNKYIELGANSLGKIKSKLGVYTCIGDHDNWAYRPDYRRSLKEVGEALAKNNIPMIDNKHLSFKVDSASIGVTFVTDNYVTRINGKFLDSLSVIDGNDDINIFLTHQPNEKMINEAVKNNYDLMLAGHTHGGQVSFLFPFYNLSPTLLETKYVKGEFKFDNLLLIVTKGLGMSLAPVRYNATPEITLIKFKNAE